MSETWLPWRDAWDQALYGADGFYLRNQPADHFRTSVHTSTLFAAALLELARRLSLDQVVDFAAGSGELLAQLRRLDPKIRLLGVELRDRPDDLPDDVGWVTERPNGLSGLVVANEWLDNVPCEVVQVDETGLPRLVEVCLSSGEERLGGRVDGRPGAWLERWWPVNEPGQRAEVGLSRDEAWAALWALVEDGVAVAVDYGHVLPDRPPFGTLTGFRSGREVPPRPDGSGDITAHVAIDSVAHRCPGSTLLSQRQALTDLGVAGRRPPLSLAQTDPTAYVRRLGRAGEAAELTRQPGLGDFKWLVCPRR